MEHWDYGKTWYHGSPIELKCLRKGSTITQDRKLAETFSHKPQIVSIDDTGRTRHNGDRPGYLYRITEKIQPADVTPHPQSSLREGDEWLINRELQVSLIDIVPVIPEELYSQEEAEKLLAAHGISLSSEQPEDMLDR